MKLIASKHIGRIQKAFYIAQIRRRQWLNQVKLLKFQEKKLKMLINHAYHNVQFYRDLFDSENLNPTDIKTIRDLKKIPIISKKEVFNSYPHKIIDKNAILENCYNTKTTGSSGTPLDLSFSLQDRIYFGALINYVWNEIGIKRSDKFISVRDESFNIRRNLFSKLGVSITKNISVFDPLENIAKELSELKPDVIYTYPSIFSLIADEIQNKQYTSINPRILLMVGETLTDALRKDLSEKFNADIFVIYASEEFGMIAFECEEHNGYHIITDNVVVELLKEGKEVQPGEEGEIVVTGLSNHCMPLIRYRLGDIVIPLDKECSCGRGFPMIKQVVGRKDDYFILPSGRKISPRTMNEIGYIHGIKAYKTIQRKKDYIVIKVVRGNGFDENTIAEIKKEIQSACLGEEIKVDVEIVKEIPKERTGKIRAIVSNLG